MKSGIDFLIWLKNQLITALPRAPQSIAVVLQPPPRLQFPYVLLGPVQSQDWSASAMDAQTHQVDLTLWSRDTDTELFAAMVQQLRQALAVLPTQWGEERLCGALLISQDMRQDSAAQLMSWHALYRFRSVQMKV